MSQSSEAGGIACSLSDEAFRERRALVRASLRPHVVRRERFDGGLRITFADAHPVAAELERFLDLERRCCGFLSFAVTAQESGLVLTVTGPPGAGPILDAFADWTMPA